MRSIIARAVPAIFADLSAVIFLEFPLEEEASLRHRDIYFCSIPMWWLFLFGIHAAIFSLRFHLRNWIGRHIASIIVQMRHVDAPRCDKSGPGIFGAWKTKKPASVMKRACVISVSYFTDGTW
jgi:hypothetical protein